MHSGGVQTIDKFIVKWARFPLILSASRKNSLRTQEKLSAHLVKTVSASSENCQRI